MNHNDFKERRYLKGDFFKEFTLGDDEPGVYNWIDEHEKELGCQLGWTEESVEYYINDWRYRGKLIPKEGADAAFGCSYTFGYGVNTHWPGLMGVVNCGVNAGSNDMITRLAISYCRTFNPKNIYVMWSFDTRRECANNDGLHKFKPLTSPNQYKDAWYSAALVLQNDFADTYNNQKNKLLLSSFCKANNINLHQTHVNYFNKMDYPLARDNMHPGPDWHLNVSASLTT